MYKKVQKEKFKKYLKCGVFDPEKQKFFFVEILLFFAAFMQS